MIFFDTVFERVKEETKIKTLKELAHFLGKTPQNISNKKKTKKFPVEWAYRIGQEFNLLTEWIMTGTGPKRLDEKGTEIDQVKSLQNDIVCEIDNWLTQLEKDDPGRKEWFRCDFEDKYPRFAEWKRKEEKQRQNTPLQENNIA